MITEKTAMTMKMVSMARLDLFEIFGPEKLGDYNGSSCGNPNDQGDECKENREKMPPPTPVLPFPGTGPR